MLQLQLVKRVEEEEDSNVEGENDGLNHGAVVLKTLVEPWSRSDRIVCADSYFSSVNALEEMSRIGLQFIGVVKTATEKFQMTYLSNLELQQRGDVKRLFSKDPDGKPYIFAFVCTDRERRYFISSSSSLGAGTLYTRHRWRQVSMEENAEPERVELTIPQPLVTEIYYETCDQIDQHNR